MPRINILMKFSTYLWERGNGDIRWKLKVFADKHKGQVFVENEELRTFQKDESVLRAILDRNELPRSRADGCDISYPGRHFFSKL